MNRPTIVTLLCIMLSGCASTKTIPLFNPSARPLNQLASAEEMLVIVNSDVVQARIDGIIDQRTIDKSIAPSLNKAERIILGARAVLRSTSQPTTQPEGTVEEAKAILISVRTILINLRGVTRGSTP